MRNQQEVRRPGAGEAKKLIISVVTQPQLLGLQVVFGSWKTVTGCAWGHGSSSRIPDPPDALGFSVRTIFAIGAKIRVLEASSFLLTAGFAAQQARLMGARG